MAAPFRANSFRRPDTSRRLAIIGLLICVVVAPGSIRALGYEQFTLNWLTSESRLVSAKISQEIEGSPQRDVRGEIIAVTARFKTAAIDSGLCTVRFQKSIHCTNQPGVLANTVYVAVKARRLDTEGRGVFPGEPGRIYARFRELNRGNGLAESYFECKKHCDSAPTYIVLVWLGD